MLDQVKFTEWDQEYHSYYLEPRDDKWSTEAAFAGYFDTFEVASRNAMLLSEVYGTPVTVWGLPRYFTTVQRPLLTLLPY